MGFKDNVTIAAAGVLCFTVVAVVCAPSGREEIGGAPPPPTPATEDSRWYLTEFLPVDHVQDGTIDYAGPLRDAVFAAAGGTLVLPHFPVRVAPAPGQSWAVRITKGLTIEGAPGASLVVHEPGVQALRAEEVEGLVLRDFRVEGPGEDGAGLAHGLVQVTGGSDVRIEGLTVEGADADGIAVAGVHDVRIEGCLVRNASKASVYVSSSRRVTVRGNTVVDFGGHATSRGDVVGVGIQLSSNAEVLCEGNLVDGGVGTGILCNALMEGDTPRGALIRGNRVRGAHNGANVQASSGIRLANGSAETGTRTVVSGNVLEDCGAHGIYLENHDGAVLDGNWISGIERAGILVATVRDALVVRNVLRDIGTEGSRGLDAIQLINGATGVVVRDNELRGAADLSAASAHPRARDLTDAHANAIHPRVLAGTGPPVDGQWYGGDLVLNSAPAPGAPLGWFCVATGIPGTWRILRVD